MFMVEIDGYQIDITNIPEDFKEKIFDAVPQHFDIEEMKLGLNSNDFNKMLQVQVTIGIEKL